MGNSSPSQSNLGDEINGYSGDDAKAPGTIAAGLKARKRNQVAAIRRSQREEKLKSRRGHCEGLKRIEGVVIYTTGYQHLESVGQKCPPTNLSLSKTDFQRGGNDKVVSRIGDSVVERKFPRRHTSTTAALKKIYIKHSPLASSKPATSALPNRGLETGYGEYDCSGPLNIKKIQVEEPTSQTQITTPNSPHIPSPQLSSPSEQILNFTLPKHYRPSETAPNDLQGPPLPSQEAAIQHLRGKHFREACDRFERKYRLAPNDPRLLERMRSPSPDDENDGECVGFMKMQPPFDTWD